MNIASLVLRIHPHTRAEAEAVVAVEVVQPEGEAELAANPGYLRGLEAGVGAGLAGSFCVSSTPRLAAAPALASWAEQNQECLRVFSLLDRVDSYQPEVTNTDLEWRQASFDLLVAYPMTNRYGSGTAGARTRTEVMRSDMHQLETAIGLRGFATITNAAYLVDRSDGIAQIDGDKVSFLRGSIVYGFHRSMP